jgi:hypothetical protein
MRVMADLAERYGHGELRISHEQNVILPHVHKSDLPAVWAALREAELATANIGLVSDIIACPGMDYCALATARSIPIAQQIALRFEELKVEHEVGPLKIKISGCINACGHHHVGHIGILGLDRAGVENYQVTLGGDGDRDGGHRREDGPGLSGRGERGRGGAAGAGYLEVRRDAEETFLRRSGAWGPSVQGLPLRGRGRRPMPRDVSPGRARAVRDGLSPVAERVAGAECPLPAPFGDGCAAPCDDRPGGRAASPWCRPSGAESVVLLHMAAVKNRHLPVLFIDTEMLFAETLAYQLELTERLRLSQRAGDPREPRGGVRAGQRGAPAPVRPDACCALRRPSRCRTR